MGFRFRKRIKIIPGLSFNLSKSGISTSIGGKGLTVNLKDGHTKTTASIPGTGLSYSETSTSGPGRPASALSAESGLGLLLALLALIVVAAIFLV